MERLAIMPSNQMTLRFTCPSSGQELDYPVPADFKSLAKRWSKPVQLHCPHCGFDHRFLFREGYPEGVLAGFGCAGAQTSITDLMSDAGGAESRAGRLGKPSIATHALASGSRSRRAPAP
jgi:rRNA maturation protein Nop10